MSDILIRREGAAGRITLNRPQALNALTHDMIARMTGALHLWAADANVALVLVDSAGGKAFCAGGDLRSLYKLGPDRPGPARQFWADEYRLNAAIARYPKSYVAIMDGIVMGGGAGISAHGSHRIVTENTAVAMPEVTIGFMPDAGGTWLLGRAPGKTGLYLGLTGIRIAAADTVFTGFADSFIPAASLPSFVETLIQSGDAGRSIAQFSASPGEAHLEEHSAAISQALSHETLLECLTALDQEGAGWSRQALRAIAANSPFSLCCAFEAIRRAEAANALEDCLKLEYRFAFRSLRSSDFLEGIRAAIIDRDRQPRWNPPAIEDVRAANVSAMLSSLGSDELHL